MSLPLRDLLTVFSPAPAALVGAGVAVTYLASRFRRDSDAL